MLIPVKIVLWGFVFCANLELGESGICSCFAGVCLTDLWALRKALTDTLNNPQIGTSCGCGRPQKNLFIGEPVLCFNYSTVSCWRPNYCQTFLISAII